MSNKAAKSTILETANLPSFYFNNLHSLRGSRHQFAPSINAIYNPDDAALRYSLVDTDINIIDTTNMWTYETIFRLSC